MLFSDKEIKIVVIKNYAKFKVNVLKNEAITRKALGILEQIMNNLQKIKNLSDPFIKRYQNKIMKYMEKFKKYSYHNLNGDDYDMYMYIYNEMSRIIQGKPKAKTALRDLDKNNEDKGDFRHLFRSQRNNALIGTFTEDIEYLED